MAEKKYNSPILLVNEIFSFLFYLTQGIINQISGAMESLSELLINNKRYFQYGYILPKMIWGHSPSQFYLFEPKGACITLMGLHESHI